MGENLAKAVGAEGRRDCLMMDPAVLVLVTEPKHPLYDPRVHLEPDDAFVASIDELGIIEPIECRRNGDKLEVAIGRQRTKAARIVNERRAKRGEPPLRVPTLVQRATDSTFMKHILAENEGRRGDSVMMRAQKVQAFIAAGHTEEEAARACCTTVQTVQSWLKFLDLDPKAQKAVESGQVTFTVAVKELSKLPREKQVEALATLEASGAATRGSAGEENVRRAARGEKPDAAEPVRRMRNRKTLEKVLAKIPKGDKAGDYEAGVRDGVRLAMGDNVRKLSGYLE
jgi:ParB family chromosome partitioning protein